jgi:hypothetical protein
LLRKSDQGRSIDLKDEIAGGDANCRTERDLTAAMACDLKRAIKVVPNKARAAHRFRKRLALLEKTFDSLLTRVAKFNCLYYFKKLKAISTLPRHD